MVGAGIAGLVAAYRLYQAGVPVDIVETRNRIGGRIYTLQKDVFLVLRIEKYRVVAASGR